MLLVDKVGLFVLVLTLGAQVLYRRSFWFSGFFRKSPLGKEKGISNDSSKGNYFFSKSLSFLVKVIWVVSVVVIFGFLVSDSVRQYYFWSGNPVSKHLLPPDTGIYYFLSFVGFRFFAPWMLALFAAMLVSRLARKLNRKFGERFFEHEEIELMALGIFLTGYPGFFFYIASILVIGVLLSVFYTLLSRGRLPFYYFWMPLAIFAMIIENWFVPKLGLTSFWGQFIIGDFGKLIFGF